MTQISTEDKLSQQINHVLDKAQGALSPDVEQALARARQTALANAADTPLSWWQLGVRKIKLPPLLLSAAACSLVVVLTWSNDVIDELPTHELVQVEEISTDIIMIEDIEFVAWLSEQSDEENL